MADTKSFSTPILLVMFNRPYTVSRVLEVLRKVRPAKLFITADGPRPNRKDDPEKCRLTREAVKDIDWPCEVKTLYREKNLGCKVAISTAIDWFFNHVEEGIILEDDCLPEESFFGYCTELLEKYRDDDRVMHIAGTNFQQKNNEFFCPDSYYFSKVPLTWGWATWRRAWALYDIEIKRWPEIRASGKLYEIFKDSAVAHRWEYLFDQDVKDRTDPLPLARLDWDGRWNFAVITNEGASIVPRVNLVSNIGFISDARIVHDPEDERANIPTEPIELPLHHPEKLEFNLQADQHTHKYVYNVNRYWHQRIKWFIKSNFRKPYSFLKKLFRRKT